MMKKNSQPIVSIIGRPNVGKSSLFNRMLGKRKAIVDSRPGVTRDRIILPCSWNSKDFQLVDTGGIVLPSQSAMERLIVEQVYSAIKESALIIFIVDAQTGVTALDSAIGEQLKRHCTQNVLLVANKTESQEAKANLAEFYSLGLGDSFAVSAIHGHGIADLMDAAAARIQCPDNRAEDPEKEIKVAIVGRPNAGKSSLVNCLCREARMLVDDKPGTTRDAVDVHIDFSGKRFVLIDTAGMRKKSHVHDAVEYYSLLRATASIDRCDVAVVVLDASVGIERQDSHIMRHVLDQGKGLVIAVNKWDLVTKDGTTYERMTDFIHSFLPETGHIPIVAISSVTGRRVQSVLDLCGKVYAHAGTRINPKELREFMRRILEACHPPARGRKPVHVYSIVQENVFPPTFVGRCSNPRAVQESYTRYVRNRILEQFRFEGCPIRIHWKSAGKGRQE